MSKNKRPESNFAKQPLSPWGHSFNQKKKRNKNSALPCSKIRLPAPLSAQFLSSKWPNFNTTKHVNIRQIKKLKFNSPIHNPRPESITKQLTKMRNFIYKPTKIHKRKYQILLSPIPREKLRKLQLMGSTSSVDP